MPVVSENNETNISPPSTSSDNEIEINANDDESGKYTANVRKLQSSFDTDLKLLESSSMDRPQYDESMFTDETVLEVQQLIK